MQLPTPMPYAPDIIIQVLDADPEKAGGEATDDLLGTVHIPCDEVLSTEFDPKAMPKWYHLVALSFMRDSSHITING